MFKRYDIDCAMEVFSSESTLSYFDPSRLTGTTSHQKLTIKWKVAEPFGRPTPQWCKVYCHDPE